MLDSAVYIIWTATVGLQLAAFAALWKKRMFRILPVFTCSVFFGLTKALVLWLVIRFLIAEYFYVYWACEFVSAIFGLLVLHEVLTALLWDRPHWCVIATRTFQWTSAVLVLATVATSASGVSNDSAQITNTVLALERALRLSQCGLLIFVIVFSAALHLQWKHQLFGIILGLAVLAGSNLVLTAARLQFGRVADKELLLLKPMGYLAAAGIWTFYAWSSQAITERGPLVASQEQIAGIRRWKQVLAEIGFS